MKYSSHLRAAVLLAAAAVTVSAVAQQPVPPLNRECQIEIYPGKLDQKPKILAKPDPKFSFDERRKYEREVITLSAILCGSGKVTDIKVRKGPEDGLNEKAIEAARRIQFVPAEKDGNKVSRVVILKYQVR